MVCRGGAWLSGFAQAIPCRKLRIRFHSNWSQWQEFQAGSRIRAGDPIGEVGNSGDSLEPNLHFHVMNNLDPTQADGTPVIFVNWKAQSYSRSPVVRSQGIIPRGEFVGP